MSEYIGNQNALTIGGRTMPHQGGINFSCNGKVAQIAQPKENRCLEMRRRAVRVSENQVAGGLHPLCKGGFLAYDLRLKGRVVRVPCLSTKCAKQKRHVAHRVG
jgi:hypothetical protein